MKIVLGLCVTLMYNSSLSLKAHVSSTVLYKYFIRARQSISFGRMLTFFLFVITLHYDVYSYFLDHFIRFILLVGLYSIASRRYARS